MSKKKRIIISIGSNFNQKVNIDFAKRQLATVLENDIVFSKEIWTMPVGIESDKFINCICVSSTNHTFTQMKNAFKHIEKQCGRSKKNNRENIIPLDIDILMYGDEKFHNDDWSREYIKKLIGDFENEKDNLILDPTIKVKE